MGVASEPFTKEGSYLEHPMIRNRSVEWRDYQVELARSALGDNSLVALPTGLGKTIVAALIVAERLNQDPRTSVIMLAPTRPLCQQHRELMIRVLKL
ncbi:MAG TPA: DEAD/DEAH box helicase, partial [Thermoproteota archaeon]|nr:DEAD/DEAH box helicase [Thermoproteota archaeon]